MSLTVITPTGDRPEQFELCKKIMRKQTLQPDQWLVVDDGHTPLEPCPEFTYLRAKWDVPAGICTLKRNLLRAIPNVSGAKVVIIEDDDWYPANYLEMVSNALDSCEVYGNHHRRYINLSQRSCRTFSQKQYSIWSGTGFRKELLPELYNVCSKDLNSHAVDTNFYEKLMSSKHKVELSWQSENLPVGFKGWGVGREGATPAHSKASKFEHNTNLVKLIDWVGSDAVDYFKYTPLKSDAPGISVVVPTYNSEDYLAATLRSVRKSVGVDIELIVVDDGSTQPDKLERIAKQYDASFFATKQHAGANTARNIGALMAEREYILFCDSDTLIEPWCLSEMRDKLLAYPNASWCYCDFWIGSEKINKMRPFDVQALKGKNHCSMISLHRKADFAWLDETMLRLQDWEYWLRLALTQNKFGVYMDKPGFVSVQHVGRISNTIDRGPYALKMSEKTKAWLAGKRPEIPHLLLHGNIVNTQVTEVTPVQPDIHHIVQPDIHHIAQSATPAIPSPSIQEATAPAQVTKYCGTTETQIDVVLPLSGQSIYNNLELRLALRSIAENLINIGMIYVVSDHAPDWLQNVRVISFPDLFAHNKDANIIDKISKACQVPELSERFLFWSDDQVLLKPVLANDIGPTAEPTDAIQHFQQNSVGWRGRMHRTGIKLQRMSKNTINFDAHVPQPMNKTLFKKMLRTVPDYIEDMPGRINGYCINTLYFNLFGIKPAALRPDNGIKVMQPMEPQTIAKGLEDKVWCGYNNVGLTGPLRKMLEQRFQERCMYEKY